MGVKGLLKELRSVTQQFDSPKSCLSEFSGKTVAVDLSSWLYKGAYGCARSLALGYPTKVYIHFVLKRLRMLKFYGVSAILVADNEATTMKANTEASRRDSKDKNKANGLRLLEEAQLLSGSERHEIEAAADRAFQGCISVTFNMVSETMKAVMQEGSGVSCSVMFASHEADAQLAYLCQTGEAVAVVTEDSDLVLYSAIAETPFPLLLKMDEWGNASKLFLDMEQLFNARSDSPSSSVDSIEDSLEDSEVSITSKKKKVKTDTSFIARLAQFGVWGPASKRMLVQTAVLGGCDYIDSLPGVGLKSAQQLVIKHMGVDPDSRIAEIAEAVCLKSGCELPDGFVKRARLAEANFYFAQVYDRQQQQVVHFSPLVIDENNGILPRPLQVANEGPCLYGDDEEQVVGEARTASEVQAKLQRALEGVPPRPHHERHSTGRGNNVDKVKSKSLTSFFSKTSSKMSNHTWEAPTNNACTNEGFEDFDEFVQSISSPTASSSSSSTSYSSSSSSFLSSSSSSSSSSYYSKRSSIAESTEILMRETKRMKPLCDVVIEISDEEEGTCSTPHSRPITTSSSISTVKKSYIFAQSVQTKQLSSTTRHSTQPKCKAAANINHKGVKPMNQKKKVNPSRQGMNLHSFFPVKKKEESHSK